MAGGMFKKYNKRVASEGWLNAVVCAAITGLMAFVVTALVCWAVTYKNLPLCLGVPAAIFVIAIPAFYFLAFRPSDRSVAKRVDALGFDERLLAMKQFEGDNSYMAMRQRQDAERAMNVVGEKIVRISVPKSTIIMLCISLFLCASASVGYALFTKGKISGMEELFNPPKDITIKYVVEGGGKVVGEGIIEAKDASGNVIDNTYYQVVKEGSGIPNVAAVANDGNIFVGWSDGSEKPFRLDKTATGEDETIHVVFEEAMGADDPDPGVGGTGKPGNGNGNESENGVDPPPGTQQQGSGNGGSGNGMGGTDENHNQIDNGNSYYGDHLGESMNQSNNEMGQDNSMSNGQTGSIGDYYGSIGGGAVGGGSGEGSGSGSGNGGN